MKPRNWWSNNIEPNKYYILIFIVSIIAVVFLPFLGSSPELGWNLPVTAVGWVVYILTKFLAGVINICIFYAFMQQAKVNIKDNPFFIEANEILRKYSLISANSPRSPEVWTKIQYKHKGLSIAITTALGAVGITQAILVFDWITMLSYLFTVVMGLAFGWVQMGSAEEYWTGEYWQYAKQIESKNKESLDRISLCTDNLNSNNDTTDCGGRPSGDNNQPLVSNTSQFDDTILGRTNDALSTDNIRASGNDIQNT